MTAVEYFWSKIALKVSIEQIDEFISAFEQAKQMEKEQIVENNKLKTIVEFYEQGCGKKGCKVKEPHVH